MKLRRSDVEALPSKHRAFWEEAARLVPEDRLFCDPVRTLAYGTDASFYRLVPKVVAKVRSTEEVQGLLGAAHRTGVPVTFRAAGTSLSGQAVTEDALLLVAGGFRGAKVLDGGARIALEPGVVGADANALLAPFKKKIGPDPASIGTCMAGGIVANNASGMCCGTTENSYRTVESMKLVFADGSLLDTGDPASRRAWAERHGTILEGLSALRREILADEELAARIREKFRIKNTTGYGLNSFVDFEDPFDVLVHLVIGSEGTLAFLSEVVFRTVEDYPHRASALAIFPDIEQAAQATMKLATGPVTAVELIDRAGIRSAEKRPGMPAYLAGLPGAACALLVEARAPDAAGLAANVAAASALVATIPALVPLAFTTDKAEQDRLWDVRRGLFPAVGAARKIGTTVIIEDVAFPIERLAEGVRGLTALFAKYRYDEAILFGHARDGNLHFVFTQDFGVQAEVDRYAALMDEVAAMVVGMGGALKAEHGTGRNMAPFVELEWGAQAYAIMKRVKALFDPANLLNPGVILNDDPKVHLANLKPLPPAHEIVDRCIECGFCEPRCPSKDLTLTPRQRITVRREIARAQGAGEGARLDRFLEDYGYLGDDTCAADGLCSLSCPVSIDTGAMTKALRAERNAASAGARRVAEHFAGTLGAVRAGLAVADASHAVLGTKLMGAVARGLRAATGGALPLWNPSMPRPQRAPALRDVVNGGKKQVVYFPACVARAMGPARGAPDRRGLHEATLSVLAKAGWDVLFPREPEALCCGLAMESKGYAEAADAQARRLEAALLERTGNGALPVLCDTSPCLYRMRKTLDPRLKLYEPVEFIHDHLLGDLTFTPRSEPVAIHVTCSSVKMGLNAKFKAVAERCATKVLVPTNACCGFAGDKGFTTPELNASALSGLAAGVNGATRGYSNSRTCEIGLSEHAGIPFQSIVYLVDACTAPLPR
jgi:D-lactate dehydrogenase